MNLYQFRIPVFFLNGDGYHSLERPADGLIALISNDFDHEQLEQYARLDYLVSLRSDVNHGKLIVTAECTRAITDTEIEAIRDFLSGQCSDGWGENGVDITPDLSVFFWDDENDVKYLAPKKAHA